MISKKSRKGISSKEFEELLKSHPQLGTGQTKGEPKKKRSCTAKEPQKILEILQKNQETWRAPRKEMNATEKRLDKELELERLQGHILAYHFESFGLCIAPKTWYFPDFVVFLPNGELHVIEVKGFLRDDAAVKYKVAVGLFPGIHFHMVRSERCKWKEMYGALLNRPEKTDGKNCRITR